MRNTMGTLAGAALTLALMGACSIAGHTASIAMADAANALAESARAAVIGTAAINVVRSTIDATYPASPPFAAMRAGISLNR